MLDTGEK